MLVIASCARNQPESREAASRGQGGNGSSQADTKTTPAPVHGEPPGTAGADRASPPAATVDPALASVCPADMVAIAGFCIDRYEVHLRAVTPDGAGQVHPHYRRPTEGQRYVAVSQRGVFPQAYISRIEAQAACRQATKRLCTRGEWMLACRGTPATPSPGSNDRPCNNGKAHLLWLKFGGGVDYEAHFNSPELNKTPGYLAKTGAFDECLSAGGVHDMVGNLHEWVSDSATRAFLAQFAAEGGRQYQHKQAGNGIFMGGFYSTKGELGPGCLFTTVAHDAGYHDYSTGFRCCRPQRSQRP